MSPSKAATPSAPTASPPNNRSTTAPPGYRARWRFFSKTSYFIGVQPGNGRSAKSRSGFDPHQHHEVEHPMFGPATQPAHAPVVEPGAQRNRSAKAKVFRFNLHAISGHSFGPHIHPSVRAEWQVRWEGQGPRAEAPFATFADLLLCCFFGREPCS